MDGAARLVRAGDRLVDSNENIEAELERARSARQKGHEGQARVCARRAAGMAIREWSGLSGDALKQLKRLQAEGVVPEQVREAARRLSTTVQLDHTLPFTDDPIEDAQKIIEYLTQRRE